MLEGIHTLLGFVVDGGLEITKRHIGLLLRLTLRMAITMLTVCMIDRKMQWRPFFKVETGMGSGVVDSVYNVCTRGAQIAIDSFDELDGAQNASFRTRRVLRDQ